MPRLKYHLVVSRQLKTAAVFILASILLFLAGCTPAATSVQPSLSDYLTTPVGTLPDMATLDVQADTILALHRADGGSTYSLRWGNLSGTALYVASLYPDIGLVIPEKKVNSDVLKTFVQKNIDLLSQPRCAVGTWYNQRNGQTYVDVSVLFADKGKALEEARKYNQITIWDLKNSEEIQSGGTGTAPEDLPDVMERLLPEVKKISP